MAEKFSAFYEAEEIPWRPQIKKPATFLCLNPKESTQAPKKKKKLMWISSLQFVLHSSAKLSSSNYPTLLVRNTN
jgi:hypothetical protein